MIIISYQTATLTADINIKSLSQLKSENKAFKISAQIKIKIKIINLLSSIIQIDYELKLNLITEVFLKTYLIFKKLLSDIDYHEMFIKTAIKIEFLLYF